MAITTESTETPFPTAADTGSNGLHGAAGMSRMDRVVQSAHHAVDRLAEKASPAFDAMTGQADQLSAMQEEWLENARNTVREHPLAAIGAAVVFGMVVARLAR